MSPDTCLYFYPSLRKLPDHLFLSKLYEIIYSINAFCFMSFHLSLSCIAFSHQQRGNTVSIFPLKFNDPAQKQIMLFTFFLAVLICFNGFRYSKSCFCLYLFSIYFCFYCCLDGSSRASLISLCKVNCLQRARAI